MTPSCELLVVGAGPTGLALAIQARMMGVEVRILERRLQPRVRAPALAVHPRTMEVLRGLGVADELIGEGLSQVALEVHVGDSVVSGSLSNLRLPATEYPFVFFAPQPQIENVLRQRLVSLGVDIEWGATFLDMDPRDDGIVCRVDAGGEERLIRARYVAGCDGARSRVRDRSGIVFRGHSYRESIAIADVRPDVSVKGSTAHAFVGNSGILFLFPLPTGRWRLIGPGSPEASPESVATMVDQHTGGRVGIAEVDWVDIVAPEHRVAETYRWGPVFLAGDAAHVHSPAGAQGMNTGIQDAVNLGWKLALALHGAPEALLDTYQQERRPVAKHVVRLTGLAFALEVSEIAPLRWGRRWVALPAARLLLPRPCLVSLFARLASGLDTRYRIGAFERRNRCDRYRPGKRLPDGVIRSGEAPRAHRLIEADRFHLLIFDNALATPYERLASDYGNILTLHHVGPNGKQSGWVLVRPDGYIAASRRHSSLHVARSYLGRWLGNHSALREAKSQAETAASEVVATASRPI